MSEEKVSRRSFFKQLVAAGTVAGIGGLLGGAAGGYLAPRKEPPEPSWLSQIHPERGLPARIPTPEVAVAGTRTQVSLEKFDALTQDAYMKATTRLIDVLGRDKWKQMVEGKRVVLKPNWVSPQGADPKALQGSHTNPYLLVALAKEAHDSGASRVIFVESSATGSYTQAWDRLYINAANKENMGGGVTPITEPPEELKFVEKGDLCWEKARWIDVPNPYAMPRVVQPESLYGKDVVLISCPPLRNHLTARVTLGLKGVGIGCQPSTSYSGICAESKDPSTYVKDAAAYKELEKEWHDFCKSNPIATWSTWRTLPDIAPAARMSGNMQLYRKGRGHGWAALGFTALHPEIPRWKNEMGWENAIIFPDADPYVGAQIADVVEVNPISMVVIDAGVGQQLTGYVDNKAHAGSYFLIGGYDPVATDAYGARMMGWNQPLDVWPGITQLHFCEQKGMGTKDVNRIEVLYEGKNYMASSLYLPDLGYNMSPFQRYQRKGYNWADFIAGKADYSWANIDYIQRLGPPSIPKGLEAT